jgi:hypothetical protein
MQRTKNERTVQVASLGKWQCESPCSCVLQILGEKLMIGIGAPKKKPAVPAETASLDATQIPSWMAGEAPTPSPRKKKPRIDSGGQLVKGSMRAA